MDHTLKHIQTELAEEQQRLAHLREAFQVQYCADELDAAGLLATAHLAQSRAARSAQHIRGLQSLLENGESGPTTGLTAENRSMHGLAGNC